MAFWRPFRRPNRNLGTMDGNPSVLDEVNAEGPPLVPVGGILGGGLLGGGIAGGGPGMVGDVIRGIDYWDKERTAAVEADLNTDMASDFDALGNAENAERDALGDD